MSEFAAEIAEVRDIVEKIPADYRKLQEVVEATLEMLRAERFTRGKAADGIPYAERQVLIDKAKKARINLINVLYSAGIVSVADAGQYKPRSK